MTTLALLMDPIAAIKPQKDSSLGEPQDRPLAELDVALMRKDPPIDTEYLYATQMLALAETQGTLVVNRTQALRDANKKLASTWFPQCAPPTLVTREQTRLRAFLAEHNDIIIKLLDAMGGESVPYALARVPAKGETRGNLAAGGVGVELSELDTLYGLDIGGQLMDAIERKLNA